MRPLTRALIVLAVGITMSCGTALAVPIAQVAQLAPSEQLFKLGFKALADQIPDVVGQPLEEEHWGPNGDSLQQTTRGLMVWRKADNWTAFTDGSTTWVNGPSGIQARSNGESFSWEVATAPASAGPTEITLYDRRGIPTAYIAANDENTIYLWTGEPTAYLYEDHLYGFNGHHLGWFQDGILWDYEGIAVGFTRETLTASPKDESSKAPRAAKPARQVRDVPPDQPALTLSVYTTLLSTFLQTGQ